MMFRKYVASQPNCIDARCEMIAMLMSLDHQVYPQALDEVAMNVTRAEKIDANNTHLRELKARIAKLRAPAYLPAAATLLPPSSRELVQRGNRPLGFRVARGSSYNTCQ